MRHRLSDEEKRDVYMPHDTQPKQISTMHSLGHQIILENLNSLNLTEDFKLIDSDPLKRLLFEDAAQIAGFDRAKGRKALKQKQRGIQRFLRGVIDPDQGLRPGREGVQSFCRQTPGFEIDHSGWGARRAAPAKTDKRFKSRRPDRPFGTHFTQ